MIKTILIILGAVGLSVATAFGTMMVMENNIKDCKNRLSILESDNKKLLEAKTRSEEGFAKKIEEMNRRMEDYESLRKKTYLLQAELEKKNNEGKDWREKLSKLPESDTIVFTDTMKSRMFDLTTGMPVVDKDTKEKLQLSEEQEKAMRTVITDYLKERGELMSQKTVDDKGRTTYQWGPREEDIAKIKELKSGVEEKLKSILSPSQYDELTKIREEKKKKQQEEQIKGYAHGLSSQLGLDDTQKVQLTELFKTYHLQYPEKFSNPLTMFDDDGLKQQIESLLKTQEQRDKYKKVLQETEAYKKLWKK
ncbi:MAG: hypothetical protein V1709_11595 [Planctomycetota bacterium]